MRVGAGKRVDFCRGFVLKEIKLLSLRPARHMGVLLFHRVMSVSDGKARSRAILVFFGLDSAPPSFRHVGSLKRCSRVRRPSDLDNLRRRGT